jgi:hypothetical protein
MPTTAGTPTSPMGASSVTDQAAVPLIIRTGLWVAAALACACNSNAAAPAASDPKPAANRPSEPAAQPAAEPARVRCGDFLTTAEAQALGLDAKRYDEDATARWPGEGVACANTTIYPGHLYDTIVRGMHAHREGSGLALQEGPTIGSASLWSLTGGWHSVAFHSTNKRFAGRVTDTDKALVEKVARALLANMDKK